jgi:hypothetical protein
MASEAKFWIITIVSFVNQIDTSPLLFLIPGRSCYFVIKDQHGHPLV